MAVCPACGFPVHDTYNKCPRCQAPLKESAAQAQVDDVPSASEPDDSVLILTEARSKQEIRIDSSYCILGRGGDYRPELFSEYVSHTHLEVRNSGGWQVCHLGMNPDVLITRSGRDELSTGVWYQVHDGDRLRLANQIFLVTIEVAEPMQGEQLLDEEDVRAEQQKVTEPERDLDVVPTSQELGEEGWFVTCRKCGAVYRVGSADGRVSACASCLDALDKRDIRRVAPVFGRHLMRGVRDAR